MFLYGRVLNTLTFGGHIKKFYYFFVYHVPQLENMFEIKDEGFMFRRSFIWKAVALLVTSQ